MKKSLLVFLVLVLYGCVDGTLNYPNSGYGYPDNRDCSYYGNCTNRPYNGGYNSGGYNSGGYNRCGGGGYHRCGGNKRCGSDRRCGGNKRCGDDNKRCGSNRDTVINVPPASKPEIRPSCPSGTVMDSRGCRVTDPSKRRPGGDGYINPCSSGYYSGGRCVSN